MATLVITVEVDVDPKVEDAGDIARYVLNDEAWFIAPVGKMVSAEWSSVDARTDVPALLAKVERLQADNDRLRGKAPATHVKPHGPIGTFSVDL